MRSLPKLTIFLSPKWLKKEGTMLTGHQSHGSNLKIGIRAIVHAKAEEESATRQRNK